MDTVLRAPFGRAMLVVMALGLIGYALWRLVEAVTDPERRGTGAKALALRASFAARGLVHAAIGLSAVRIALGSDAGGDSGSRADHWTARVLDMPAGAWLVGVAGAGVVAYGLYQLYRAYAAKLSRQLDLGQLSAETGRWAIGLCRFGIAARGVVFCLIGGFLVRAAMRHDAAQAGGIADSLRALGRAGQSPLALVAFGLVAYGAYELVNARYRRISAR